MAGLQGSHYCADTGMATMLSALAIVSTTSSKGMYSTHVVFGISGLGMVLPCCMTRDSPFKAKGWTRSKALEKGCSWVPRLRKIKDGSKPLCTFIEALEFRPLDDKSISKWID